MGKPRKLTICDNASIPDFWGKEKTKLTAVLIPARRSVLCCKCGHHMEVTNITGSHPDFSGYVCQGCGVTHTSDSVFTRFRYIGDTEHYTEYSYDGKVVTQKRIEYKLQYDGENLVSIVKLPVAEQSATIAQLAERNQLCSDVKEMLRTEYADLIPPMLKILLDAEAEHGRINVEYYARNLSKAKNLYENDPVLFPYLCRALGDDTTYEELLEMYPAYLTITKKLLEDWNIPKERRNSGYYYKPTILPDEDCFDNYENLSCLVNYYQSGRILWKQFKSIIQHVDAVNNPTFLKAFKNDYSQMRTYLNDLKRDGVRLSTVNLNVREYYQGKTRDFFLETGLTPEQYEAAKDKSKNSLEFLINLGTTRVKRTK